MKYNYLFELIRRLKKYDDEFIKKKIYEYEEEITDNSDQKIPDKVNLMQYIKTQVYKTLVKSNYVSNKDYNYFELRQTLVDENVAVILNKLRDNFIISEAANINSLLNYVKKVTNSNVKDYICKKMRIFNKKSNYIIVSYDNYPRFKDCMAVNYNQIKSTEDKVLKIRLKERLHIAVDNLESSKQKHVIKDYYFNELTLAQIGKKLDITPQAVHYLLARAYKNLKKEMVS